MSDEENDAIGPDEDYIDDDDMFQEGESVLITKEDLTMAIGLFVGLTDFGVITKGTHRTEKMQDRLTPAFRNDFTVGLYKLTVAELKDMAAEEDISLVGLKKKIDIVNEVADVMMARMESQLEPREEFVALKRPVLTFTPWHKLEEMRRLSEFLEEMELQEFSDSLDMFSGIDAVGPDMGSDEQKVSDE
jgi:hypothetical protein